MKKIILSIVLCCTIFFSFGKCCKKKKNCTKKTAAKEVWMRYDETKCDNPWHFNWFAKPTEAQIAGAVKGNLEDREINILQMTSEYEEGLISCEACHCPNGRRFFVRVHQSDAGKLKALKFYEVKDVPDIRVDDDKQ